MQQQRLAPLVHGEADGAEVIAGGFQSQGVEGQEPSHGLPVGQRAEENQGELMMETNQTQSQDMLRYLWMSLCKLVFRLFKCSLSLARLW